MIKKVLSPILPIRGHFNVWILQVLLHKERILESFLQIIFLQISLIKKLTFCHVKSFFKLEFPSLHLSTQIFEVDINLPLYAWDLFSEAQ